MSENNNQAGVMDAPMETTQNGLLQSDTSASEVDNSEYYKIERIENSPFTKVCDNGKWKGVIGRHVVTPDWDSEVELMEYIENKPWTMIIAVLTAMKKIEEELKDLGLN